MNEFEISSLNEYGPLFKEILKRGKKIVFLRGDLGAGKTTFVSLFLAYKYKLTDEEVSELGVMSPTYSVVNEYLYKGKKIIHADFYRVSPSNFDVEELMEELEYTELAFFEWEGKLGLKDRFQNEEYVDLEFFKLDESKRKVKLHQ